MKKGLIVIENIKSSVLLKVIILMICCALILKKAIIYIILIFVNLILSQKHNVILCYISLCILLEMFIFFVALIMVLISIILDKIMKMLKDKVLGKNHEKSINYTFLRVWFIKFYADIDLLSEWIKFNLGKVKIGESSKKSMIKIVDYFTLENIIQKVLSIVKFFFRFSVKHVIVACVAIYVLYGAEIVNTLIKINIIPIINTFSKMDFNKFNNVLILILFAIHSKQKVDVHLEIRKERLKHLYGMEEKLIYILMDVNYELEKNIEVFINQKHNILIFGAENISKKDCRIENGNVEFKERLKISNTVFDIFNFFEKMDNEFDRLLKLDEDLKESGLNYTNIFMVDREVMINKLTYFYVSGQTNFDYIKTKLLCRESMEKWYRNFFIKSNQNKNYNENEVFKIVCNASKELDLKLKDALQMQVYLKIYQHQLMRRFEKLYNISKLDINHK